MSELVIPCEKIARLASVLRFFPNVEDEWTHSFRFEKNYIIVTNRTYMVIERHDGGVTDKPFHITADPAFVQQCTTETQYGSKLFLVYNDMLKMVTARTAMGYQHPGNLLHNVAGENVVDRWRDIVPPSPATEANNGWMLNLQYFQMFAESSPSKYIVFEKCMDVRQPSIVRDKVDPNWFAVFWAKDVQQPHEPATLPEWFK